jgi:hypothetical protein
VLWRFYDDLPESGAAAPHSKTQARFAAVSEFVNTT